VVADAIEVRPARREDIAGAAKLAAMLVREHHAYDPLRFMCVEPIEEGYARFLAGQIGREEVVFLIARHTSAPGGEVVGYIFATLEDRNWSDLRDACGKIHDVYVDASVRRHGVATRLVESAVQACIEMGAPRIVLMAAWRNDHARALFARLGFRPTMLEMTREA
jgi:ribosomal protein S18 acetylase RimI-like enzyme